MTFVSYAQNQEDVLLLRALGHISAGFYVDVGASHPEEDSVTKAFYDRGWTGINIEPSAQTFALLNSARIYDVNLNVAVSETSGSAIFFDVPNSGLSSIAPGAGDFLAGEGFTPDRLSIRTERLETILDQYGAETIHFLKIDVEGAEELVIKGAGLHKHRPWIILVEATLPNSNKPNHFEWDHLICDAHYHFVYFDGVNRYYIADERPEIDLAFHVPVNVLDNYIRLSEHRLKSRMRRLELDCEFLSQKVAALENANRSAQDAHQNAIAIIEKITSKRILGKIKKRLRRLLQLGEPKALAFLHYGARVAHQFISRFPKAMALARLRLEQYPGLKARARALLYGAERKKQSLMSTIKSDDRSELRALLDLMRRSREQRSA